MSGRSPRKSAARRRCRVRQRERGTARAVHGTAEFTHGVQRHGSAARNKPPSGTLQNTRLYQVMSQTVHPPAILEYFKCHKGHASTAKPKAFYGYRVRNASVCKLTSQVRQSMLCRIQRQHAMQFKVSNIHVKQLRCKKQKKKCYSTHTQHAKSAWQKRQKPKFSARFRKARRGAAQAQSAHIRTHYKD